ncbi:MAG TPA: BON domain-containing protein [Candidatus Angelobacter sp.]|nr:BON domain-containing protein [Candidatus Angelobacter sp.]
MNKVFHLVGLVLALAVSAGAQNSSQTQTPPVNPTTPATQIGTGAQSKSGTPAQTSTTPTPGQASPTGTAEPPAQSTAPNPTTGGVAGAVGASASQAPATDNSPNGVAAMSDSDLEAQIQNALNKEPTLSSDSTHVKVAADTVELDGTVATNKEKIMATRIVQSYAGNKKLVNRLNIGGGNGNATSRHNDTPDSSDRTRPTSTTNPSANPEPNKGSQPPKK